MSLAKYLNVLAAPKTPHGPTPQNPPKPNMKAKGPRKNNKTPKPAAPTKPPKPAAKKPSNKPRKIPQAIKPAAAPEHHGLFHHLGQHVAKWWHSLTHRQKHTYTKIHPKSPITKVHKGQRVPRKVNHAEAAEYHKGAADFHHDAAQKAMKNNNQAAAIEHSREARRHRAVAGKHMQKIK